jgi:hypothetical protein
LTQGVCKIQHEVIVQNADAENRKANAALLLPKVVNQTSKRMPWASGRSFE